MQQSFSSLLLHTSILRALSDEGYDTPTPIQQKAIPDVLSGKDLIAVAQTGTGKTAAFSLPILHRLQAQEARGRRRIRALILTPTRELALQIDESLRTYGRHLPLRSAVILGGVPAGKQIKAVRQHPDVLVATPGRLLDLYNQGHINLDQIEVLVFDEADRMLDMGFLPDVKKIVSHLPTKRQTLLFSATMSSDIARLARQMQNDPVKVDVTPKVSVPTKIAQQVLFVEKNNKRALLSDILKDKGVLRALVFTRTKHLANRLMKHLLRQGITADAIHSNKTQSARQKALSAFHRGHIKVLVGTDIIARGIDVDGVSHVINYELPHEPESYVHRIGRTARAGTEGTAMSFCDAEEVGLLKGIERLTRVPLTTVENHPFRSSEIAELRQSGKAVGKPVQHRRNGRSAPSSRKGSSNAVQEKPRSDNTPKFGRRSRTVR
ncbi:MAG: DEAD/DEAH box helicase [Candidatus Latescibacteria bacterium]|jgi:ATP-dependent RNA helicase RhlE|nr:DEAD/DEAH box helicase [Candidatus Latescibacterota bacterium]MBT5832065.1 DEAD/DEAH box helicase [Candidatus Latescibacterota bacterium]